MAVARPPVEIVGVVTRVRDYADNHRILEVVSPTHGKVSVFARGGRASRRRFQGMLDLFVSLRMQCVPSRDAWTLREAELLDARTGLRRSLEQLETASLLVECASLLSVELLAARRLHGELARGLDAAARGELGAAALGLARMVAAAGIAPDTRYCSGCRGSLVGLVGLEQGGVVCASCALTAVRIPVAALLGETIALSAGAVEALVGVMADWIELQTGERLRSRAHPPI